jgi:hypothetical protein
MRQATSGRRGAGLALAFTALSVVAARPAGAQMTGPCTATVNGVDVNTADTPARAIEVDADAVARVSGTDATGAPFSKVGLRFPPLPTITVHDDKHDPPDPTWGGDVKVKDYATFGVGLYQVQGQTDDCRGRAWIKVTGRSPFLTAAGGLGALLAAGGLLRLGLRVARARPSWSNLFRSGLAGLPVGLGLALLAQQAGALPLTGETVAAWAAGGISAGALANLGVAALRG